jgi:hypothetical protein
MNNERNIYEIPKRAEVQNYEGPRPVTFYC